MTTATALERARIEGWADEENVRRVLAGEPVLFEILMRRHYQRVYRAIRSILREDSETEDVMQEAHVRAYEHAVAVSARPIPQLLPDRERSTRNAKNLHVTLSGTTANSR